MNLPRCRWWTPAVAGLLAWVLSACSGGGSDGLPVTMTLTAVTVSPGEISLGWTAHPGSVLGYDIMRNGEAAHPYHLSGTSYTDSNLNAATGYCYVVYAAVFPLGTMGRSNRVCLTTPATAGWVLESIDSGRSAALALDSNDLPRVSYLRSGGVAHALRHGDGWLRTLVDGEANFHGDTSLAVDRFNFDQLSYFDYSNNNLRHADNTLGPWASSTGTVVAALPMTWQWIMRAKLILPAAFRSIPRTHCSMPITPAAAGKVNSSPASATPSGIPRSRWTGPVECISPMPWAMGCVRFVMRTKTRAEGSGVISNRHRHPLWRLPRP
jgi:hypothetical protein